MRPQNCPRDILRSLTLLKNSRLLWVEWYYSPIQAGQWAACPYTGKWDGHSHASGRRRSGDRAEHHPCATAGPENWDWTVIFNLPGPVTIADRFEIADPTRAHIGRGSMGEVFRAMDRRTGNPVAVKVMRPEAMSSPAEMIARFRREGAALRQLDHPNIVAVIDTVESPANEQRSPAYYLIMEYMPGGSLKELLAQRGRLAVDATLDMGLDLADALTRAHRLGIIHRDLKPGNVLLADDGTPRLTDFGLARVVGLSTLTRAGAVMGTIEYLSPEACRAESLDEASDIWSFGVMLWEMLSGDRPFRRENIGMTLAAILEQEPGDLAEHCPDAPDSLKQLLALMLRKERTERIPSMRLVGAEMEAILLDNQFRAGDTAGRRAWHLAHPAMGAAHDFSPPETVNRLIAQSYAQGDHIVSRSSLTFAYSARQQLELDERGAMLLLRSALTYGEAADPWLAAFGSAQHAGVALTSLYDEYPRPDVRERIVAAAAGAPGEASDRLLLAAAARDDAPAVRSAASLAAARRGYQEQVVGELLRQVQESNGSGNSTADAAPMAALSDLVDEFGMPPGAGLYLRLQLSLAHARRRWRKRQASVRRNALQTALGGGLMVIYGAAVPPMVALTSPEDYAATLAFLTLGAYFAVSIIIFGLYGLMQGWVAGLLLGLADALRPEMRSLRWRYVPGALSGLVFTLFFNAAQLLNESPPPAPPAVVFAANVLFGLLIGSLLSLVIPPLGTRRSRRAQWLHIGAAITLASLFALPYSLVVFQQQAGIVIYSRLGLVILLPLTIGLPFLFTRPARRDEEADPQAGAMEET